MTQITEQFRKDLIIATYNAKLIDNNIPTIDPAQYRLSLPHAYVGNKSNMNTKVSIVPMFGSGNQTRRNLYYNRINFSIMGAFSLSRVGTLKSDLLDQLNDEFGLDIRTSDIVDGNLPDTNTVVIGANPNSHMFIGTVTITLT